MVKSAEKEARALQDATATEPVASTMLSTPEDSTSAKGSVPDDSSTEAKEPTPSSTGTSTVILDKHLRIGP